MSAKKLSETICRGLDEAQTSIASHRKLLTSLVTLYEKTQDPESFFNAFFPSFSNVLLVYKREPAVERVIDFVATFAVKTAPIEKEEDESEEEEEEDETSFFSLLIDKLLTLHKAKDKAIRFRVCQLLAKLFSLSADSDCIVGSKRMDSFQQAMLLRLYDKIPVVRIHAVSALEFLQDPDPNSPITSALLELMAKDSSPEVRRCILNKLALTDGSLTAVIERTRDTKETIRHDAFVRLAEKCSIRNFSISKRIQLLQDGFNDLSKLVVKGCFDLLHKWSLECNGGDLIALLVRLDVESYPDIVELALVKLFDALSIEDLVVTMSALLAMTSLPKGSPASSTTPARGSITPSKATPTASKEPHPSQDPSPLSKLLCRDLMRCEEVFYWSCLCRYLHKKGEEGEEGLEKLLPTLSEFCDYIRNYVTEVLVKEQTLVQEIQSHFVLQQLCSMLAIFDRSDEVGRCRLCQLVCDLLTMSGFPTGLIGPLLELQTQLWPKDVHRIEKLVEAIAELRQPSMMDSEGRGSSVPPGLLSEESYLSSNLSFLDLQDDPNTLLRCLTITCELLKGLKTRKLDNPILLTLVDSLLFPCIQNEHPYVRDMALHCLGLASLLDLNMARNHILLFLQVSQVDHESVQATALKVVFDLLHVYGFEAFNVAPPTGGGGKEEVTESQEGEVLTEEPRVEGEGEEEEVSNDDITQRLLNIMAMFLEGESALLREVASEGICKLLLSRRILSEKLLAKLLLLWYNPVTQEETTLCNVLGLFFPSFAALDRSSRLSLSEVYLPVMRMVLEAPPSSPLADINTNNLSDFILQLTRPVHPNEESVHDSLAISVCNELLCDPTSSDIRGYSRTLSLLQLTPSNTSNAADLCSLLEEMRREVVDKTSLRYLNKFGDTLAKINPKVTGSKPTPEDKPSDRTVTQNNDDRTVLEDKTTSPTVNASPAVNHVKDVLVESPQRLVDTETVKVQPAKRKHARVATAKKTTKKGGRRKKIALSQQLSSEEEESGSENIEPGDIAAVVPTRSSSTHVVKKATAAYDILVNGGLNGNEASGSEDSDDSIVGEHSPFIKHVARKRRSVKPLRAPQFSDDEDDTLTAVR